MSKLPGQRIRHRLELRRRDFTRVTGRPFQHFYCPILATDEPAELIQGHIVNQAIEGSSGAWDIQRADVDNFYGAHFESGFELLQYLDRVTPYDLLTDKDLGKKFRPMILKNGEPVTFTSRPSPPENFLRMGLGDDEKPPVIGIKMSLEELLASVGERWEFAHFTDSRIPALVSLLKAAHLTLFHLLGYRYALSSGGLFVGSDILGRFFRSNVGRKKDEVLRNAWIHFREFQHMARPLIGDLPGCEGTVTDRRVLVCFGTSGRPWAIIVIVKAAGRKHAVMLPGFGSTDSVSTFLDFLKNDNERIHFSMGELDAANARWNISPVRAESLWPKRGVLYPESPIPPKYPPPEFRRPGE